MESVAASKNPKAVPRPTSQLQQTQAQRLNIPALNLPTNNDSSVDTDRLIADDLHEAEAEAGAGLYMDVESTDSEETARTEAAEEEKRQKELQDLEERSKRLHAQYKDLFGEEDQATEEPEPASNSADILVRRLPKLDQLRLPFYVDPENNMVDFWTSHSEDLACDLLILEGKVAPSTEGTWNQGVILDYKISKPSGLWLYIEYMYDPFGIKKRRLREARRGQDPRFSQTLRRLQQDCQYEWVHMATEGHRVKRLGTYTIVEPEPDAEPTPQPLFAGLDTGRSHPQSVATTARTVPSVKGTNRPKKEKKDKKKKKKKTKSDRHKPHVGEDAEDAAPTTPRAVSSRASALKGGKTVTASFSAIFGDGNGTDDEFAVESVVESIEAIKAEERRRKEAERARQQEQEELERLQTQRAEAYARRADRKKQAELAQRRQVIQQYKDMARAIKEEGNAEIARADGVSLDARPKSQVLDKLRKYYMPELGKTTSADGPRPHANRQSHKSPVRKARRSVRGVTFADEKGGELEQAREPSHPPRQSPRPARRPKPLEQMSLAPDADGPIELSTPRDERGKAKDKSKKKRRKDKSKSKSQRNEARVEEEQEERAKQAAKAAEQRHAEEEKAHREAQLQQRLDKRKQKYEKAMESGREETDLDATDLDTDFTEFSEFDTDVDDTRWSKKRPPVSDSVFRNALELFGGLEVFDVSKAESDEKETKTGDAPASSVGDSLFRAVAHQIYGDASKSDVVKHRGIEYLDMTEPRTLANGQPPLNDILRAIALVYNKNIEIYDFGAIKKSRVEPLVLPYGDTSIYQSFGGFGVLRISAHCIRAAHSLDRSTPNLTPHIVATQRMVQFNSVVDPSAVPPLGDTYGPYDSTALLDLDTPLHISDDPFSDMSEQSLTRVDEANAIWNSQDKRQGKRSGKDKMADADKKTKKKSAFKRLVGGFKGLFIK